MGRHTAGDNFSRELQQPIIERITCLRIVALLINTFSIIETTALLEEFHAQAQPDRGSRSASSRRTKIRSAPMLSSIVVEDTSQGRNP